jgi:hypothetical protein
MGSIVFAAVRDVHEDLVSLAGSIITEAILLGVKMVGAPATLRAIIAAAVASAYGAQLTEEQFAELVQLERDVLAQQLAEREARREGLVNLDEDVA